MTPSPALLTEAHRLLDRARMIAEAPAGQPGQLSHSHPSSQMPPGAFAGQVSSLAAFGQRINAAIASDSDIELAAANRWCQLELDHLQHGSVVVAETPAQFDARIVDQYEGVPAPQVARAERSYVRRVRDARITLGRTARLGLKPTPGQQ